MSKNDKYSNQFPEYDISDKNMTAGANFRGIFKNQWMAVIQLVVFEVGAYNVIIECKSNQVVMAQFEAARTSQHV